MPTTNYLLPLSQEELDDLNAWAATYAREGISARFARMLRAAEFVSRTDNDTIRIILEKEARR